MKTVDDEVRELAILALRNAFYEDYSALVNKYLSVGKGLSDHFKLNLQELSNVFSRDDSASDDVFINVYTENGSETSTSGWDNLLEALEHPEATTVWVQGVKVFEKRKNLGWYYIGH